MGKRERKLTKWKWRKNNKYKERERTTKTKKEKEQQKQRGGKKEENHEIDWMKERREKWLVLHQNMLPSPFHCNIKCFPPSHSLPVPISDALHLLPVLLHGLSHFQGPLGPWPAACARWAETHRRRTGIDAPGWRHGTARFEQRARGHCSQAYLHHWRTKKHRN